MESDTVDLVSETGDEVDFSGSWNHVLFHDADNDLFGNSNSLALGRDDSACFEPPLHGAASENREESWCPSPSTPRELVPESHESGSVDMHAVVSDAQWQFGVTANFSQFFQTPPALTLPWETGVFAEIFGGDSMLSLPVNHFPEPDSELMDRVITATTVQAEAAGVHTGSCFDKAVRSVKDLEYFENKSRQLELACGQWLELLSCEWHSSGVGEQLAEDMQKDATGVLANETLRASFGVKSPQTILKRAACLRRYFKWHALWRNNATDLIVSPLPLHEPEVWEFFSWLRDNRRSTGRGYTNAATFLETVRFAKFTLNLKHTETILESRRLLGFAAIERLNKGPTRQAPPLELEHLKRLHEIVEVGACITDRLGAAVMLICIYGRTRWSDLRYIHHVVIEEGRSGFLTLYTTEHKTSAIGARREQYLPLVVPWMGVTQHEWVRTFLAIYSEVGLDIHKVPLGPLLPAPRLGGGFGARPLSTTEAADWLRLLLAGTPGAETFRAHSMKTTLLVWAAKAGLEKEVRAVLGHHATALEGSDVVYGRHLQSRALRKLNMLLHRVRLGLSLETEPLAPNPFATPCMRTPAPDMNGAPATPFPPLPTLAPAQVLEGKVTGFEGGASTGMNAVDPLGFAVESLHVARDAESVKEEELDEAHIAEAAEQVSLFSLSLVHQGIIEIDSSSGSDSSSESSSSSTDEPVVKRPATNAYSETVPDGVDFYKHRKSAIVHKVKCGNHIAACGVAMSSNLVKMPRVLSVRWPKCLKCFPKDSNRIRNVDQLGDAIESARQRAKR